MTRRILYPILLSAFILLNAQDTLNNEGIIKLVKSGMTEDLIINVIQQQPGTYMFGAADLVALKDAGVSEKIISAMLARGRAGSAPGLPAAPAKELAGPVPHTSIRGPGIYYKKANEYFELLTEDVEWRTSGGIKNFASAGIVKKDLNGAVSGASSRNFLTHPAEIILSPPTGVTVNSYILLPLKPSKGAREFNVGPVNRKSGVAKGAIPFGVEKIGDNIYRMVFQSPLAPGEYGILTATPSDATGNGKMHTFRILL